MLVDQTCTGFSRHLNLSSIPKYTLTSASPALEKSSVLSGDIARPRTLPLCAGIVASGSYVSSDHTCLESQQGSRSAVFEMYEYLAPLSSRISLGICYDKSKDGSLVFDLVDKLRTRAFAGRQWRDISIRCIV